MNMVNAVNQIALSTQAQIAVRSLLPIDKERIRNQMALLERFPTDPLVQERAHLLPGNESDGLHIMRASPNLRILFRYQDGQIEVVDIVTHERLERMHNHAA